MQSLQCDEGYNHENNLSTESFHAERTVLSYAFSHEYSLSQETSEISSRIRQAFYNLIPKPELAEIHLKLSRVLKGLNLESPQEPDENGQHNVNLFVKCFDF